VQQLDLCAGADFLGVALDGRGVCRAEILLEVVQRYLCRKASSSCTLIGSAIPMLLTRVEVGHSL
jgi:hypothetical protein